MTDYDKINSELHSLDREAQELDAEVDADLHNMKNIADEANRVADVAHNASEILDDLDREFEEKTSLDKLDVAFMFLAAAIQCVRWYFLPNNKGRLTSQEGDKLMGKIVPKKWQDILLGSVPYDAIQGGADVDAGLGGLNHRYRTLGHDPIAGWIFGPVNILSDTLTKTDFTFYNVADMVITGQTATTGAFSRAYEQTRADKMNLPAAIARQALHLGSDVFTKSSKKQAEASNTPVVQPTANFTMRDFKNEINGLNDAAEKSGSKKNKVSFIAKVKNFFANKKAQKNANQ